MRRLIILVFLLFPILACSVFVPKPTVTPTSSPEPTELPTSTIIPSLTVTPTLTFTPTIIPSATHTVTPTATSTPRGYTLDETIGFSIIFPLGWVTDQTVQDSFWAQNSSYQLFFSAVSAATDSSFTIEQAVALVQDPTAGFFSSSSLISQTKITLGDSTQADEGIVEGKVSTGIDVKAVIVMARNELKDYIFIMYGSSSAIQSQEDSINSIFSSIQLIGIDQYHLDRSQTLVMLGYDPIAEDLDPAQTTDGAGGISGLLYSGLVSLTPELQIEPDLAESWKVDQSGTVYTFTLRDDIKFQSGKPITAADVKYSWERAADPETASSTAGTYLGDIVGFKEKLAGKANEISGVRVLDDRTLEVTLDAPKTYFLAKLSYPCSFVVDQVAIETSPNGWQFSPNASGPYTLDDYQAGVLLVLKRNENYPIPAGIPYIAMLLNQSGSSLSLYESNQIDIASLSSANATLVQSEGGSLKNELYSSTAMCTKLVQFDNTTPPMDDINVRKAFALAIDPDRLVQILNGGLTPITRSILPPSMPGYSSDLSVGTFDPAAAKAALSASKYANNLPVVTLTVSGYANNEDDFITALVNMWQTNLGVTVEVEYLDPANYTQEAVARHGQMVSYGWCADYPDPQNFLEVLYQTGSDFNVAGYSNSIVDGLLSTAQIEQDVTIRLSLYRQIETLLLQDYAALPILNNVSFVLVKPAVKGYIQPVTDVRYLNRLTLVRG
jgi:oligopeptide transport system substrate-binding protein